MIPVVFSVIHMIDDDTVVFKVRAENLASRNGFSIFRLHSTKLLGGEKDHSLRPSQ